MDEQRETNGRRERRLSENAMLNASFGIEANSRDGNEASVYNMRRDDGTRGCERKYNNRRERVENEKRRKRKTNKRL
jgi:hypothetical protein